MKFDRFSMGTNMKNHERFDNRTDAIRAFEFERLGGQGVTRGGIDHVSSIDRFHTMLRWLYEKCYEPDDFKRIYHFSISDDNRRCENCEYGVSSKAKSIDKLERECLFCVKNIPFEVGRVNVCDCWQPKVG